MGVTDIHKYPDINGSLPAAQERPVYEQLTITDWLEMKERLRLELQSVTESFVRIGYALRKIDDQKMYETDGYKSIAEFARAEYGLEPSTVSRFMSINREYSIDGYSERLRPEYIGMGQSKLSEMLQLPEADRALITPDTQREDIRELKRFNKEEPARGEADDLTDLIEAYFKANREDLNELYSMEEKDPRAAADLLNPSGSKTFRKGLYMMFFYEESVKIKKFGEDPVTYTWLDYLQKVDEIFGPAAAGDHTWERYFGEEIAPAQKPDPSEEKNAQEQAKNDQNAQEGAHDEQEDDQEDPETVERDAQDQEMAAAGEEPEAEENGSITGMNPEKMHDTPTGGSKDLSAAMNPPEGIAPAQKEEPAAADDPEEKAEPAAAEPIETKYKQGEEVYIRGKIDMITFPSPGTIAAAGGPVNYRIKTDSGKTVWCKETDICSNAAECDEEEESNV